MKWTTDRIARCSQATGRASQSHRGPLKFIHDLTTRGRHARRPQLETHATGFVRPQKVEVNMQSQYEAARQLLAAGAFIEQVSDAPLRFGSDSAPLPAGLFQQLLAHKLICQSCRVSGKTRYVATEM